MEGGERRWGGGGAEVGQGRWRHQSYDCHTWEERSHQTKKMGAAERHGRMEAEWQFSVKGRDSSTSTVVPAED